jgi:hypothetical protein
MTPQHSTPLARRIISARSNCTCRRVLARHSSHRCPAQTIQWGYAGNPRSAPTVPDSCSSGTVGVEARAGRVARRRQTGISQPRGPTTRSSPISGHKSHEPLFVERSTIETAELPAPDGLGERPETIRWRIDQRTPLRPLGDFAAGPAASHKRGADRLGSERSLVWSALVLARTETIQPGEACGELRVPDDVVHRRTDRRCV